MSGDFIGSRKEMEEILHENTIGYLGLCVEGKPYVIPLNYSYHDGRILFHCAMEGLKLDAIRTNPEVCFTVGRQTGEVRRHFGSAVCHPDNDSVVCFGRARIVDDLAERLVALNAFNRAFDPKAEPLPEKSAQRCGVVEIRIREMTGRRERERKRTLWRHVF